MFFGHTMQLVGSQFPDQGLNPSWTPNHWTIREFPPKTSLLITCNMYYCCFRMNRVFFYFFIFCLLFIKKLQMILKTAFFSFEN